MALPQISGQERNLMLLPSLAELELGLALQGVAGR
jgi:hypothetical protein